MGCASDSLWTWPVNATAKMLPNAVYERVPMHSNNTKVFGSMLVNDKSNTPYSDATQVRAKGEILHEGKLVRRKCEQDIA